MQNEQCACRALEPFKIDFYMPCTSDRSRKNAGKPMKQGVTVQHLEKFNEN